MHNKTIETGSYPSLSQILVVYLVFMTPFLKLFGERQFGEKFNEQDETKFNILHLLNFIPALCGVIYYMYINADESERLIEAGNNRSMSDVRASSVDSNLERG